MSKVIDRFKEKTRVSFRKIDGLSADEVEDVVLEHCMQVIQEAELDIVIQDLAIDGSRCRGLEQQSSDLDVVLEYSGNLSEDSVFNVLHEDSFFVGDILVDVNPIVSWNSGVLEDYLQRAEEYLVEKSFMSLRR